MSARPLVLLLAIGLGACRSSKVRGGDDQELIVLARASCDGVTAVWRGVAEEPREAGFRRLEIVADGQPPVTWVETESPHVWPEVVFSPRCTSAALLSYELSPYAVVATKDVASFVRGEQTPARYLDDQEPCSLTPGYGRLRWLSEDEVEYVTSDPSLVRRRKIADAPDHLAPHPCRDPSRALYDGDGAVP